MVKVVRGREQREVKRLVMGEVSSRRMEGERGE
jgi:hypothetical protein